MSNRKKKQVEAVQDFGEFALLVGGQALVTFTDNSDIVTDTKVNPISITPKNKDKEIEFVQRGRNNSQPEKLIHKIGTNVTVASNVDFKTKIAYGDGILVYRKKKDPDTGKIINEELIPEDAPEIFEFLELNDYPLIAQEIANDLTIFYDAFIEYVFNKDDQPKIVRLNVKETTLSRISVIDETTGRSEWHGYSAKWHEGCPDDVIVTPLLQRDKALLDLLIRMGKYPNVDGETKIGEDRRFIHNIKLSTPGRFYYSRPYYWSIFPSGWYDFSSSIPRVKRALIQNQMIIRYKVYIREGFWQKIYDSEGITDKEKQLERKLQFLNDLNEYLAGEENAGKSFVSHYQYDRVKGYEEKDIIIEALDTGIKGGEYIEDSEETSNTLCYAQGVHPSLIGAAPGKGKSINGTEARELHIIQQAMSKIIQDACLKPLYMVKKLNGWPDDIYFSVVNVQLTTTDKGTGAQKNTGIKKEPESNE